MSATQIPIPDLRFESSFFRSLDSKAKSDAKKASTANSLTTNNEQQITEPVPITPGLVIQVILKDVIIMPLLQGIVWSGVWIVARPWLSYVAQHGRDYGVRLFKSLGLQNTARSVRRA